MACYSVTPNAPKKFIAQSDVAMNYHYPVVVDNVLKVLLVFKYHQNNELCASATPKSANRKKRATGIVLDAQSALPLDIIESILADNRQLVKYSVH